MNTEQPIDTQKGFSVSNKSGLMRNAALNLLGLTVPMLIALVAMPICLNRYGVEQFGILSIAWTLLVTFAFFDLGLGISTTKYVAEAIRAKQDNQLTTIVWSSLAINGFVGSLFNVIILILAPTITTFMIHPPDYLRHETTQMIRYAAFSIPFITISATLRGVLESSDRFDITNSIKMVSSGLLFVIPAVGALFSVSISMVVLLLTISRIFTVGVFFYFVLRLYPYLLHNISMPKSQVRTLLTFGGWVSISSFLNPLITHGENFLIPTLLSVGMLSYYAAPLEMVARSAVIPFSLAIALLPKFSFLGKQETTEMRESLIIQPIKYLLVVITPICGFFVFFSPEILKIWLGPAVASIGSMSFGMLGIAFYFHAITYVPFTAIQGLGHPELKAKLDMIQTPLFLIIAWLCIQKFGLEGAAFAKIAIYVSDAVCLMLLLKHTLRLNSKDFFPFPLRILSSITLTILISGITLQAIHAPLIMRAMVYALALILLSTIFWMWAINKEEQRLLKSFFSIGIVQFIKTFADKRQVMLDKE